MKILFTGDINFRDKENLTYEESKQILSEVLPYTNEVDFVIPNLECPLADIDKHEPIKKSGPNLICSPENICFLKALNVDAVTLANNHIGDFGKGAIKETLDLLRENNIKYSGAGKNIEDAYKACKVEKDGVSVSIISVCENEFGMATENTYGSAGYNARLLLSRIKKEKELSQCVIVVFHGGNEFNPLPSPDTVDRYRLICDMGADAVIGGHTHCPQGYEIYDGKPIVYSMGNFLFKSRSGCSSDDSWYYGYMTELNMSEEGISIQIIPYKFLPDCESVIVFKAEEEQKMLDYIDEISEIIKSPSILDKYFGGWAYLHKWVPCAPLDYSDLSGYFSPGHYNLICCESHLSQAKKVLELCFKEQLGEAEKWAEEIKKLQIMPV